MNALTKYDIPLNQKKCLNLDELAAFIGVGRNKAAEIGKQAGAEISIGRRKLYVINKVADFIDVLAEEA